MTTPPPSEPVTYRPFDPEDIPVADGYSREDFGTPDEVRGWNLCRDYVIAMFSPVYDCDKHPGTPWSPPDGCPKCAANYDLLSALVERATSAQERDQ